MKKVLLIVAMLAFVVSTQAQKLPKFTSTICKQVGPKEVCTPYTDVVSYLGYAAKNTEDEVKDGKKFYYIYVWIPAVAPEIGVRMMAPAPAKASKNAVKSADYEKNASSEAYFDTYITLERSSIVSKADITDEKVKAATWVTLDSNDDSSELPANPSGSKYNSLLRYKSVASDPLKALTAGLYRVGFTTYKVGEVEGTFLAEVAAPVKLPGVGVAKTLEDLNAQINKAQ